MAAPKAMAGPGARATVGVAAPVVRYQHRRRSRRHLVHRGTYWFACSYHMCTLVWDNLARRITAQTPLRQRGSVEALPSQHIWNRVHNLQGVPEAPASTCRTRHRCRTLQSRLWGRLRWQAQRASTSPVSPGASSSQNGVLVPNFLHSLLTWAPGDRFHSTSRMNFGPCKAVLAVASAASIATAFDHEIPFWTDAYGYCKPVRSLDCPQPRHACAHP